jgi:flavin-dependent dehydrogenase
MRQQEKAAMSVTPCSGDHLVIGGGPAGAMVALRLAAAGRQVTLLEKEPGLHHKVCGEFLSPEAIAYLQEAGVDLQQLGAAVIRNLRLSAGGRVLEASLPFQALSLSRCVLDAELQTRAEATGCQVLRGIAVESLTSDGGAWVATVSKGEPIRAKAVFLATGKHDLRGFRRDPAQQGDLVGFKLLWQLPPAQMQALDGTMDLYLFSGGYGGLSPIENGIANLCLVVRRSTLRRLGGWPQLLAGIRGENRHLNWLLTGGSTLWARPLAISPIPYGYLAGQERGLWRVGDQAAVIPSFTGDGISIALHSAALAAEMYLAGKSAAEYLSVLRAQLRRSMALATWLSRAAVTPVGRRLALSALFLLPHAMQWIATATRIPQASLLVDDGLYDRKSAEVASRC